jgi:GT2 family glycosyltransferase
VIRDSLAVVVVTRRHPERLSVTLASLAADKIPGTVTVVNLTGDSVALSGQREIVGSSTLSLSHAVDRALTDSTAETIWILRDDTSIRPGAFTALASILDKSYSGKLVV